MSNSSMRVGVMLSCYKVYIFVFYQIITAFNKLNMMSEVAHDN